MKILLLTFICGIHAFSEDMKEQPKLTGKWHTVALASEVPAKVAKGGSLEIFVHKISNNDDGTINGDFFKREFDECTKFSVTARQEENGQLSVEYDGENTANILHLDNKSLILVLRNVKDGKTVYWAELFGRTKDLPDEIKKKFEQICEEFGIKKHHIRDLSNNDRCEELR